MKLPPELMDKIFKSGESNPRNARSFGKLMSNKTRNKMVVCRKVIDTGDLKQVRLLKFHNTKCTKDDLMYSLAKGHINIAKYINSAYPQATIKGRDIIDSVVNNDFKIVEDLLQVYKFKNKEEYINLFSLVNMNNKRLIKVLLDNRPNNASPLTLSQLFDDELNFLVINIQDYFKNFMSVAKNIIIDDQFVAKLLLAHEFTNLNVLFRYQRKKINRRLSVELVDKAIERMDSSILEFMQNNSDIF